MRNFFSKYIWGLVLAVFFALFLRFFVVSAFYVSFDSFAPEIASGDFVLVNKAAYGFSWPWFSHEKQSVLPAKGDFVVFTRKAGQAQLGKVVEYSEGDLQGKVEPNRIVFVQSWADEDAGKLREAQSIEMKDIRGRVFFNWLALKPGKNGLEVNWSRMLKKVD